MIVALRATHCGAKPDAGSGSHSIGGVLCQILFFLSASFGGNHVKAIVARCHALFAGWVVQQVPGQLLASKLIKRHVAVKRANHIIPIRPDAVRLISVIANRVRITNQIQPINRHSLPIMRGGQQIIHNALKSETIPILNEALDLFGRRRQSGQIQKDAPNPSAAVRGRRMRQSFPLQTGADESIHGIVPPTRTLNLRHGRPDRRRISPMPFPLCAGFHPLKQSPKIFIAQRFPRRRRRHAFFLVPCGDSRPKLAFRRIVQINHKIPAAIRFRLQLRVQSKIRPAGILVGAVTAIALVGKNRPHIAVEPNFPLRLGSRPNRKNRENKGQRPSAEKRKIIPHSCQ